MDKKQLQQHYFELERQFEKNKTKRAIKTILAFAVAFFAVMWMYKKPEGILDIVSNIVLAVILAGFHVWINAIIFGQLCDVSKAENRILEGIRNKLNE
jgi:uncharacterized PurR-regulated membrane protein YhhQ (DUF165 family)